MKVVALYGRVSTDEQVKKGYSIETQEQVLKEYAEKKGYKIYDSYLDGGFSGGTIKRPQLQRLLEDVQAKKIDLILFTRLDRWFRSVSQYHKIQDILDSNGVMWECTDEDYETVTSTGKFKVNIMLSVNQQYKDTQSEKIKETLDIKIKNGFYPSGAFPYGFKLVKETGGSRLVIDEDKRENVMLILDKFKETMSLRATTLYYNDLLGGSSTINNIKKFLTNPLLHGEYRGVENFTDGFVTKEEHDDLMSMIKKNVRAREERVYIFGKLLKCHKCGRTLATSSQYVYKPNGNVYIYKSYRCRGITLKQCDNTSCYTESTIEKLVLKEIKPQLEQYIFDVEVKRNNTDAKSNEKALKKINEQQTRLNDLYIKGRIADDEYEKQYQSLENEKKELAPTSPKVDTKKLKEILQIDFNSLYPTLNDEEKRILFRSIIDYIIVNEDRTIKIEFKK